MDFANDERLFVRREFLHDKFIAGTDPPGRTKFKARFAIAIRAPLHLRLPHAEIPRAIDDRLAIRMKKNRRPESFRRERLRAGLDASANIGQPGPDRGRRP